MCFMQLFHDKNYDLLNKIDQFCKIAASSQKQYVYHIKNKNFKGKYIYTLSELQNIKPDIFKKEIKKYNGRKSHPEIEIKILNAKWKDCVNFSTLNPIKIFQLKELLGISNNNENIEIFRFNIKHFKNLNMCLYDDNKSPKKDEAYKKVNIYSYKESEFIPAETAKYFAESKVKKEQPLIFGHVVHLLVNDKISIEKADILKFKRNSFIKL